MARLYPPSIAGVLPSFYKNTANNGTTKLVVPFSMNKVVSKGSIYGYSLRIKTTNSDILYGTLESTKWSEDTADPWVEFELPQNLLNRLVIGSFYKVQLAYI